MRQTVTALTRTRRHWRDKETLERGLMGCGDQVRLCSLPWKNSLAVPQNANCSYQLIQDSIPRYILKRTEFWAGKMAQWVKVLATKLENLSSIPRT